MIRDNNQIFDYKLNEIRKEFELKNGNYLKLFILSKLLQ